MAGTGRWCKMCSARRGSRGRAALALAAVLAGGPAPAAPFQPYLILGDAIPDSLSGAPGDAVRGRALVADRSKSLCLLCHSGPFPQPQLQGNLAPSLAGAGARWTTGQLRLRIAAPARLAPDTIMPPYYDPSADPPRVAEKYRGRTILDAQQIEDVVAFLASLKE